MFTIAYFSPTGNTLYLARKLEECLAPNNTELISIADTQSTELKRNTHLIIMYSIHGFNAPQEVEEFTKSIPPYHFESISIIAVGCSKIWINDGASIKLKNILSKKSYSVLIDEVLAMPLTFVMKFPKKLCVSTIEESEKEIKTIADNLINSIPNVKLISTKSKMISFIGRAKKHAAKMFGLELYASRKCVSCGKCWNSCPSNNIKPNKNEKPKFGFKCTMCMKRIYECPQKAIKSAISRFIPIKGGYSINDYIKNK